MALDVEREIAATLISSEACSCYWKEGIGPAMFADKEVSAVYDWCMEYWSGAGKMSDAPNSLVIENAFPNYSVMIEETSGAAPSYLAGCLKSEYIKSESMDLLRTGLEQMSKDPKGAISTLRDGFTYMSDLSVPRDRCLRYGDDTEWVKKEMDDWRLSQGCPYPFAEMNDWTGGIKPGEISTFVAPSGMGKSVFAAKTAVEAKRLGFKVFYASLELATMHVMSTMDYTVVNEDGFYVPVEIYNRGERNPQWVQKMDEAHEKIEAMPGELYVENPPLESRTPAALVQSCKAHGCDFLIVDQLQFVTMPKADNRSLAIGLAMQEFHNQIMTPMDGKKISLLLLHQLNREGTKNQKDGGIGNMSDLSDSVWIEQLSDAIWGMGRTLEEENMDMMRIASLKGRRFSRIGWRLNWDTKMTFQFGIEQGEDGKAVTLEEW